MKSHRLLIVEDEFILAMDLKARLGEMGYGVVGKAGTGAAAIAAAEQHRPDLILMDIRLSGHMDGIAAASEIRRHHDIPVIFMSAYADEETRQRAAAAEPAGFLSKLTTDRDLRTAIETALGGVSPNRS
ncbi:MAG: response regulator [Verrucomicrobia bacterium]|nr:response regulator [Verrucomicrobiota bacterium]